MNGLGILDETYREQPLVPTDDWWLHFGGHRSKVKVTVGRWGGEGIDVDAEASKYMF